MQDRTEQRGKMLNFILEENGLKAKWILEGRNPLMRAISDALYFTTVYSEQIQSLCVKRLKDPTFKKNCIKLKQFRENSYLFNDYCENPNLPSFEKINLELISNIYNTCVKVCFLSSKDQQLYSYTINNKCNENILLLKTSEDHYDTLYTIGRYENLGLCQNIVLNLMVKAIGKKEHGEWTDLNMNRYINLEYENSKKHAGGLPHIENKNKRRRHKKSFSADKHAQLGAIVSPPRFGPSIGLFSSHSKSKQRVIAEVEEDTEFDVFSHKKNRFNEDDLRGRIEQSLLNEIERNYNRMISDSEVYKEAGPATSDDEGDQIDDRNFFSGFGQKKKTPNFEIDSSSLNLFAKEFPLGEMMKVEESSQDSQDYQSRRVNRDLFSVPRYQMVQERSPTLFNPLSPSLNLEDSNIFLVKSFSTHDHYLEEDEANPVSDDSAKSKPIIIDEGKRRFEGRLKFFDEAKNYGFIVMDQDGSDIFVHYDDLSKANLPKDYLRTAKKGNNIRLSFCCLKYIGKHNRSKKAVDIKLLPS